MTTGQVHHALTVPRESLPNGNGRDYVCVVSGAARRKEEQVRAIHFRRVQIIPGPNEYRIVALGGTEGQPNRKVVQILSYLLLAVLCMLQALAANPASIPQDTLEPVSADLTVGRADDAISRLSSSLAANPGDAKAHHLLCRVYYQEKRWNDAIHECETAVQLAPLDSGYHLWLGRAYGEKADSIHSIKAYGLAKKVRDEFERAVQLGSGNVDALSDLGEFYTEAPGIVGGGKKKAEDVAQTLERYEPAQAYQLKGRIAEKDKNYVFAETEFKAAVESSRQPANAWMELASFYSRRRQWDQMLEALHAGIDADAKAASRTGPHWWMGLPSSAATTRSRNLPSSYSGFIWHRRTNRPIRPPSRSMCN